jgi:hypothetical protein
MIEETAALHVGIHYGVGISVSTQIAALRNLLLGHGKGKLGHWFRKVSEVTTVKYSIICAVDTRAYREILRSLLMLRVQTQSRRLYTSKAR